MADVVVLGGGAAGFFAAIRAARLGARVSLLEATANPLQKVRISGGGRCNVTQHQYDAAVLVTRYPRGAKELRGVLSRFGPRETMAWFAAEGVTLKTEPDGRVFPATDDSATIVDCLLRAAREAGVDVRTGATARRVDRESEGLTLHLKDGTTRRTDKLLIATGSNPHGHALAASLGHTIIPPVPSLFTFQVRDPRIEGLAGVAVPRVKAKAILPEGEFEQEGPLLITHWGLSAHSVLRLSAWGARAFHGSAYQGELIVDLAPDLRDDALRGRAEAARRDHPRATVGAHTILPDVPRRLWERLVVAAGGDPAIRWGEVPNRGLQRLVDETKRARFVIEGKGPFKEEFVMAGGVKRSEVDWRTMGSRIVPGLHFAGEALDVDALTGGYNLQNAWSTGWIAGSAMAGGEA